MIFFVVQGIQWQIINTQRMALQKTKYSTSWEKDIHENGLTVLSNTSN